MSVIVVLDTETTGVDAQRERIIEIGAIKLVEHKPTAKFHTYVNPDGVSSQPGALAVHGITDQFLKDKPLFAEVYPALLDFIAGTQLVIHNAPFDVGFLNAELNRVDYQAKIADVCEIVDTLVLARQRYPGQKNSLDALCRRLGVSNAHRTLHGALLDADLLAKVYIQMCVDQSDILTKSESPESEASGVVVGGSVWEHPIRLISADQDECAAHESFMRMLSE